MSRIDQQRLDALQSRLGAKLPSDFVATLTKREPIQEGSVALVTSERIWDVRTTYGLHEGEKSDQLDDLYSRVGDVLPPGALPFAADWGGNFYCVMLSGPQAEQVVWWDHERDSDDVSVEPIAASVAEFYERLVTDPRE